MLHKILLGVMLLAQGTSFGMRGRPFSWTEAEDKKLATASLIAQQPLEAIAEELGTTPEDCQQRLNFFDPEHFRIQLAPVVESQKTRIPGTGLLVKKMVGVEARFVPFSAYPSLSEETPLESSVPQAFVPDEALSSLSAQSRRTWKTGETECLLAAVRTLGVGTKAWNLASKKTGFTPRQCHERYTNYLAPAQNKMPWTKEEQQLLVKLINQYGTKWSMIAQSFPGRTEPSIKCMWRRSGLLRRRR